ncbi:DUF3106 domain-containing protein [Noviherbaspirillum saxi]|uniref:DUF3106 domain-containing protein n=1 Tax=Noviherbaspirillum saxi TaxID=2320863 RepID=A0A3A3FTI2_9BURK|nr:DUF3106 domain-containing protein [Noviherbaspirillum saxi]RJF98830.1 DUF3106 domain-containing protein [Noviherbaspirillum saxi]
MRWQPISIATRRLRAAFILGGLACTTAIAVAASGNPASSSAGVPMAASPAAPATKPPNASKPLWADLTPAQQQALAPLAGEWDRLDVFRKNKWLAIGNKYASMKPDEQQRVQERMHDWVKLTPEQRRLARESYTRTKQLGPDKKTAEWEQYQQLPDEQKRKLAEAAAAKKKITTLPSPAAQGKASQTIPPIKSAPKPVLEQSVTPQATPQSAIPAAVPPSK